MLNIVSEGISMGMEKFIDALGRKGLPLEPIFHLLAPWLDARDTKISTHEGYFKLCSNPHYNFTNSTMKDEEWDELQNNIDLMVQSLFGAEE